MNGMFGISKVHSEVGPYRVRWERSYVGNEMVCKFWLVDSRSNADRWSNAMRYPCQPRSFLE